ncbi:glutamyl-tRNA reductase [Deinococcus peraridilitoris]|uniref:Glutamyl-tRNA reductase n=1 Tax=Deinococcus peraridilitoris (strain DSM 19664 / LMG 22246 / CIP 109416 / KR-200) TaxID=937777 RepID=L0A3Z6_DEIPD|nr:glutamyl-tRNA reductase [Deinococcus peraridilitoris]AFZ67922.1 glutamyl-tRNA reductase [Deinococcus peraridilitoris DSM 19664]
MSSPLDFAVIGLNHKTAPLGVRERASVLPQEQEAILSHLARHADEVMLLSTCNRTEVYLASVHGDPLSAFEGAWGQALRPYLYLYEGDEAVRHLYRVAAGLDSLVIGETQIQGQVKRAWQDASTQSLTGALLNKAAQGALRAGKRVRSETGVSDKVLSVSSAAVELAQNIFGAREHGVKDTLAGRTAMIIGAGETAELTLTHLRAAGIENVIVVNRTVERARALADKLGGQACPVELVQEVLPRTDVVIASAAAPHYVLWPDLVSASLSARAHPMFLIDISMPRIIDPACASVPGAYLYNLDDLTRIVERNLAERLSFVPRADAIVEEEVGNLRRWWSFRTTKRTLAASC